MNFADLVERLVPLMAELLATLAAKDPLRVSFADVAGKTILDIVEHLKSEGMSNEALAAYLGMTYGGFLSRMRKLRTDFGPLPQGPNGRPQTRIEAVYDHVTDHASDTTPITYGAIEARFETYPTDTLRGILNHLVKYGLLSVSGQGHGREFRTVTRSQPAADPLLDARVLLYRNRREPLSVAELARAMSTSVKECETFIDKLEAEGVLETVTSKSGPPRYRVTYYHLDLSHPEGYEVALLDHFSAVVQAICKKARSANIDHQLVGGTTYSFDVPEDDPLYGEVSGFLGEMRTKMPHWLARSTALANQRTPGRSFRRITIYTGQMVEDLEEPRE